MEIRHMTLGELHHYGVKGMKWGVRRYQPYPKGESLKGKFLGDTRDSIKNRKKNLKKSYMDRGINEFDADKMARRRRRGELIVAGALAIGITAGAIAGYKIFGRNFIDKTIKPGQIIQNLAATSNRDLSKPFYAAINKRDKTKYLGLFGGGHLNGLSANVYKNSIKAGKSIKIASHNNARKAAERAVANNKQFAELFRGHTGSSVVNRKTYESFNRSIAIVHQMDHQNGTSRIKPFYDQLRKMGYGGLLDINDQKFSGYAARNPSIVFDMGKSAVNSISELTPSQIQPHLYRELGIQISTAAGKLGLGASGIVGINSVLDVEQAALELEKAG